MPVKNIFCLKREVKNFKRLQNKIRSMIDIVIPLMHQGSKHDNLELRMCLRSIEKHLTGYRNIIIIGERPKWLSFKNTFHLSFSDNTNSIHRARNIYHKLLEACQDLSITNNFLYFNDDHYLLEDFHAPSFPYYHRGEINLDQMAWNNAQYKQMSQTKDYLRKECCWALNDYDVHCPMVINKGNFFNTFPICWPEYGYGIKSMYGNLWHKEKVIECEDLKFRERVMTKEAIYQTLEGREWFSIGDRALLEGSKIIEVLNELYPKKSIYE